MFVAMNPQQLIEPLTYLRTLGFFNGGLNQHLDTPYLANLLAPQITHIRWGSIEQTLASLDLDRVWCVDCEHNHTAEEYWYIRILLDWARISRNAFRPQLLSENWHPLDSDPEDLDAESQSIEVSFSHNSQLWTAHLSYLSGWFDPKVRTVVNQSIKDSGFKFKSVKCQNDQCAFICCLTSEEVQRLETQKFWRFDRDE